MIRKVATAALVAALASAVLSASATSAAADRPDDTTPYLVQDALDVFEFGLQRLLDGIAAHIATRTPPAPEP